MPPSFFLINKTKALHGEVLGQINFFSRNSSIYFLSSASSKGDILYGAIDIGPLPASIQ